MVDPRELDPTLPPVSIPAIDRMLDAKQTVSNETLSAAYNNAMPRVRALCSNSAAETGEYSYLPFSCVDKYSDPKNYRRLTSGEMVRVRMCTLKRPIAAPVAITDGYEATGLLLEIVLEDGTVQKYEPLIELNEHWLWARPMIIGVEDNDKRTNDPSDLHSFFAALHNFDGQGGFQATS